MTGPYPVASTVPTSKRVADAIVSEWYEVACGQRQGSWHCWEPERQRALQLEYQVRLYESVSDDSLPLLLRVLGELRQLLPPGGKITLRYCGLQGKVEKFEVGPALGKIRLVGRDIGRHTFSIGLEQSELDTIWITVPYDEPVTVEHLCGWEVHDD
jgi:hypothetical protein